MLGNSYSNADTYVDIYWNYIIHCWKWHSKLLSAHCQLRYGRNNELIRLSKKSKDNTAWPESYEQKRNEIEVEIHSCLFIWLTKGKFYHKL